MQPHEQPDRLVRATYTLFCEGGPERLLVALIARAFPGGTPTAWGGLRGPERQPEQLQPGERVVTEAGEHGAVARVDAVVVQVLGPGGGAHTYHTVILRLDSGREQAARGALYAERRGPARVVPDVRLGGAWLSPGAAWEAVERRLRDIAYHKKKAEAARSPTVRAEHLARAKAARAELVETHAAFAAWRAAWPEEPVPGLSPLDWRRVALEVKPDRTEDERWELAWIARAPEDWATRLRVGDAVTLRRLGPHGNEPSGGWRVEAIAGHLATVARVDERREEPLWMLRADAAPEAPPSPLRSGCVELVFRLEGYGTVRVLCGARAQGEVWNNVYVEGERYGFNGTRWARGARPPEAVLAAVRARGVAGFG